MLATEGHVCGTVCCCWCACSLVAVCVAWAVCEVVLHSCMACTPAHLHSRFVAIEGSVCCCSFACYVVGLCFAVAVCVAVSLLLCVSVLLRVLFLCVLLCVLTAMCDCSGMFVALCSQRIEDGTRSWNRYAEILCNTCCGLRGLSCRIPLTS